MGKKVIIINAGPRLNWNTDTLLKHASKALEDSGAEIKRYDLYRLEKYTGCISCFGCKKEKFKGHCVCKDGLTPVLDDIREADALIIGSPNYLSDMTSSFRSLYERLIFQNLTYNKEHPNCNSHMIPVLLIMTCNAPSDKFNYVMDNYQNVFSRFIGPTKTFISGDTKQILDYSKTDWPWSIFDADRKNKRHEEIFPKECLEVERLAKELIK